MSHLVNDPTEFADEAAEGLAAAYPELIRRVPGGVVRASVTPPGQVAVVVGGGSGHYPAFAGLVGRGLAHGAAMGNVFASPSSQQIVSVVRAAAADAGVLLTYGNYAGDVLNFDLAAERLAADRIETRTVVVTDDISSAPPDQREKRRGIAGDLVVFRVAGWAAEQSRTLDEVAELAARANDRTRTLGVAFSGCTLPGADAPLFELPPGQMGIGMGIHGEPGIQTRPMVSARELADLLVDGVLAERPDDAADRVGVIVNGLGSVKSEELFVLYRDIGRRLEGAGTAVVNPQVGEFATSFEMAGVSLTLVWLDDELERAWTAPVYTPAFREGAVASRAPRGRTREPDPTAASDLAVPEASDASRAAAAVASVMLHAIRSRIDAAVDELGRLDAIAGDGDHGIGMQRGATAAAAAAERAESAGAGLGSLLVAAGDAWSDRAGGTSGALWGAALVAAGTSLGDTQDPDGARVTTAVAAACSAVMRLGGAERGQKTMVDAFVPFDETLRDRVDAGDALAAAWAAASEAATRAADGTADLLPGLGRARTHASASRGTPDPGAVSFALAATAAGEILRSEAEVDR